MRWPLEFASPYYHQFTFDALSLPEEEYKKISAEVAQEAYEAFTYYYDNFNGGRPFILAGFSQGALLVKEILKLMTPAQREKMAVAYVLGYGINEEDLKSPAIVPAKGAYDKGVTVSFNTVASPDGVWDAVMDGAVCCINPLNWSTDTTAAETVYHGQKVNVRVNRQSSVLVAEGFKKEPLMFVEPWPEDCLHHYEIHFYADALCQNAKDRVYRK